MNEIILINRVNPYEDEMKKVDMFFLLGDMKMPNIQDRIADVLEGHNITDLNKMVFKYNGVEINLLIKDVPNVIKIFSDSQISIYGVYQLYHPK